MTGAVVTADGGVSARLSLLRAPLEVFAAAAVALEEGLTRGAGTLRAHRMEGP